MKTTKEIIIKTVVALCVGFTLLVTFNCFLTEKYYPTLEEAFRHHSGGERNMGEILFIDEHENNLTIFHKIEGRKISAFFTSHYLKKDKNGQETYSCFGVSESGILLSPDLESIEQLRIRLKAFKLTRGTMHKMISRTPEYGFSRDEKVYNLKINKQLVDEVVELQTDSGVIYYWYFSDLIIEDFNNIKVSFE